jgi:hypothetical protein
MDKRRLAAACAIGCIAAALNYWTRAHVSGFTDFDQVWTAGRTVVRGGDPYTGTSAGGFAFLYPLPAAIVGVLFSPIPVAIASALWTALGFGVLAYALSQAGWWRLTALCSLPSIESMQLAQWSPILTAAFILPSLNFFAAAKPSTMLPVAGSTLPKSVNRASVLLGCGLVAVSFMVLPSWLPEWIGTVRGAHHFIPPIARPFGAVLLLALIAWRRRQAWLIALMALTPQAGMAYDALPLAVVPQSRRDAIFYSFATLAAVPFRHIAIGANAGFSDATAANAPIYLATLYVPALLLVLARHMRGRS